jgi:very-short-patch-repair endonuclease
VGNAAHIDRLAARQHGVFSLEQAREAGFDKHAVYRRVDAGRWKRLDHRVFGLPSSAPTWERRMWVALLSRPAAVVGGDSAAFLHGFRGFRAGKPTIVVPGSSNARSTIARVIRAEHFAEIEVDTIDGFPTTSTAETLIQLAGDLPKGFFIDVFDDLLLKGSLDLGRLDPLLEREGQRRRRGIVLMRKMLEARLPGAPTKESSYLEGLLEKVLTDGEVQDWSREHPFSINGRPSRVDVYIASCRLVIEADGRSWHMRHGAFESDRRRDNELAARGIQVLRFTYEMLTEDPEGCLETIRRVGQLRRAPGREERDPLL